MKKLILLVSILAITLGLYATVSVSGSIVGSDNPTAGLEGSAIKLYGVINYTAFSNAAGQFVIENVLSGNTFNYAISRAGYQTETGTIIVNSSNYDMGIITLDNLILPPYDIIVALNDAETVVNLGWSSPGTPGNSHFFDFEDYDEGWIASSNWTGTALPNYPGGDWQWNNTYSVANYDPTGGTDPQTPPQTVHSGTGMWGTNIHGPYTNCTVSGQRSYLRQTFDLSVFDNPVLNLWHYMDGHNLWDYGQIRVNGNVVWGSNALAVFMPWQEITVDLSAYQSLTNVEISFEWSATTVFNYAGWYIDDVYIGPADQIVRAAQPSFIPGDFRTPGRLQASQLAEEGASLHHLRRMTNNLRQPLHNPSRLPVGYQIWRLESGQESTPDLWISLTPATISDINFADLAWASLPDGLYKWAVKTVYTNYVVSNAGFSDTIRKQPNDLSALSIIGNTTPTVGTPSNYIVTVKNKGTAPQEADAYTVKLVSGTTELASVNGPAIGVDEELEIAFPWVPSSENPAAIFGKVVLPEDSDATNDETDSINLQVMPAGQFGYTVGDGSSLESVPIDMYYRTSFFQMIIHNADIWNFSGSLNGIQFYNNFVSDLPNMPTKIWLETTNLNNLSSGWVAISDGSTLVFDGNVNYPSRENNITIPFAEPFMYLSGENLLVSVYRPMDDNQYSPNDRFSAQTISNNRARKYRSDGNAFDPMIPSTTGTTSGILPMTTFLGIPDGVSHLSGNVTGVGNLPVEGILVELEGVGYQTTTDINGDYEIPNILPGTYNVIFRRYGYITQTQELELEEYEEAVINVTMQLMPTVSVSGTIVASDTGSALAGAVVALSGYANYIQSTNSNGEFTFPAVYANESYEYIITCPGYVSITGNIDAGTSAYQMGTITLSEIAYAPHSVVAELNTSYTAAGLQWEAPDLNAIEIVESFENPTFPPQDWSQIITNNGIPNTMGVYPTFKRLGTIEIAGDTNATPTHGSFQTGLWWAYEHQDEWLITPVFNCPPDAYLRFDSYVFLGSENGDHYYAKISTDSGNSWQVLWDASNETGGQTTYDAPFVVDLAPYGGQQITLAFHAEDPETNDGLWFYWFIDNVYIGNTITPVSFDGPTLVHNRAVNNSNMPAAEALTRDSRVLKIKNIKPTPEVKAPDSRALMGYEVYRFVSGQEADEASWTLLNDELISTLTFEDDGWQALPNSSYRWGVKAVYTADVSSSAALSNPLTKDSVTGNLVGIIRRTNGQGISGATVTAGTTSTTTSPNGAYSMILTVGNYSVSASANSYETVTVDNVAVSPNQNTTLNITLDPVAGEDELSPVTATTLKGNSPNPFNPTTTIYYDILEPCNARLDIYNVKGQKVRNLLNEVKCSGRHSIVFEARDGNGKSLSSGIYFYSFSAGKYNATRKMLLME